MSQTVVIGGGLSGLVCAYALSRRGQQVLLLEASDRPGGVVRTEKSEGYLLEMGPNTVAPTLELWALIGALGLENEVLLANPRTPRYVDFRGRLHRLPMSLKGLLGTRLLSLRGKLRLAREPFVARLRSSPERESVRAFFLRRLGDEVTERIVDPFVSGIFAGDSSRLSLSACLPRLARWESEYGSLLRGALAWRRDRVPGVPKGLLSFREGLESLPRALARTLGPQLTTYVRVEKIVRFAGAWTLITPRGDIAARQVVVATPAREAGRLIEGAIPAAARALAAIPHAPLAVLHLAWPADSFAAPLDGFGHLVVPQLGRRVLGAVWSSSLFSGRAPKGQVLFTVFCGGARDPETPALPDDGLVRLATLDLQAAVGLRGQPRVLSVTRYTQALPQYDLEHEARMKTLSEAEAGWPGLRFLGNYRGGVSVGDVVRNALAAF